ncbi:hypothetical protein BTHERMOSOX_243 [Bathymodiolus thermophilus thioautotrophic gill symbiont]|nr:hypothetical protein BTHERMOSOX_243 [Bathymodiolus thermophilus thioautotrophic gill symbiont]
MNARLFSLFLKMAWHYHKKYLITTLNDCLKLKHIQEQKLGC